MKSRRKFIQTLSMAGAAATLPLTSYGKQDNSGKMIHQVFFWLKDGEDVQDFKKEASVLGKCKTVKNAYMGTPASTEARDVVDNSYQLACTLFFESLEDQAAYQVDPDHLEFIKRNSDRWKSVKVYDFMI
ncbi:Dabb family protein [Anditalea andensis]|uniref:Stress protein n=1 Tax=Anditalea andensis TaxID=1048983 RepID=A0A074L3B3_9BACT|nr:Dabb family protein [Anditalea andensis]KEO74985.1 stress protein [Anditalea andensis]